MLEPLTLPFMQRALLGGLMVGFLASYYGPFIVQRRLAFLGSGLAHAAFGGVALGILLNQEPLWVAAPFTVFVALAIVWVRERSRLASDTTIGVFFAVSMAFGIIFLSRTEGYAGDAFTYLFGSLLAVTTADLWTTAAVVVLTLFTIPLWRYWAYASFDRSLARADHLPVTRHDYVLAVAIAVVVVVSIKVAGIVMIAAFLVMPAAAARVLTRTFAAMSVVSIAIGMSTVVVGLYASYYADLPSGPAIILTQAAVLAVAVAFRR
ncbi:MAG: metal ABC transporter permease [Candidatus Hydrogenedentes bacterium]|nr:metal ABC transporter permease [Candidatus Hydrogenedentota bacterium]